MLVKPMLLYTMKINEDFVDNFTQQDVIMTEKTYVEQPCAYCKGTGNVESDTCPACKGKAILMVAEPLLKCQFCKGQGYMIQGLPCRTCKGTGWMGVKRK